MTNVPETPEVAAPGQEAPKARSGGRIIVWMVVFSLILVFLSLNMVLSAIKDDIVPLQAQLTMIQGTLASTAKPVVEEQNLKDNLTKVQGQLKDIQPVRADMVSKHLDWPAIVRVLANFDGTQIRLAGLAQGDTGLVLLTGRAVDEASVMTYAATLRLSSLFKRVIVQTINLKAIPTVSATNAAPADKFLAEFTISIELKLDSAS